MASVNKVILLGTLGKDPEIRYQSSGDSVATFSLATNEKWTDKVTKEKKQSTEWHKITAFGKLAEIAQQYLTKGSEVYIEGKIKSNKYTDKEGIERVSYGINCDFMQMLGKATESKESKKPAKKVEFQDDDLSDAPF
jgi:single-strand DNA-binding protein